MKDTISFPVPEEIKKLAEKFKAERLEEEKLEKQRNREREERERRICAERLKFGLSYAKKIFDWAETFRKSDVGQELMKKSHIPTAYKNIFFFDGHVEGIRWVGLVVSARGLELDYGGRYGISREKKSPEQLAKSVDTTVLKTVCEWIDDGRVWECIERHFDYLKKKTAD